MADARSTGLPLDADAGVAGLHATEAFALLGNETRLAILLALWEAYEPGEDDNAVSFSDLFDRVDYDDAGNFSYHLEQLTGQFVRRHPGGGGYELRNTGLEIVKVVIAGAGVQDMTLEPAEIDRECSVCGARTAVSYEDGVLYQTCTACEGVAPDRDLPEGYLNSMQFHPAGLTDRTREELIAAAETAAYRHMRTMFEGLCSACSGPVDASLELCTQHESDGRCPNCDRTRACWARFECRVCKDHHVTTPAVLCVFHPAVVAFYYEHGVPLPWRSEAGDRSHEDRAEPESEMALASSDPPSVTVTISVPSDEVCVTFDETVGITNVDW